MADVFIYNTYTFISSKIFLLGIVTAFCTILLIWIAVGLMKMRAKIKLLEWDVDIYRKQAKMLKEFDLH